MKRVGFPQIHKPASIHTLLASCLALASAFSQTPPPPSIDFIENETPFLRSALVFESHEKPNRTRRGVILPLGNNHWACFDPDLLRYSAIWRSTPGKSPISYDSMAAISFPDAKAKAEKPPTFLGELLHFTPELPGASSGTISEKDPRTDFLTDGKTPIGSLPSSHGKWLGISLRANTTAIEYEINGILIQESLNASADGNIQRCLVIQPNKKTIFFRLGSNNFHTNSPDVSIHADILTVKPATTTREILLHTSSGSPGTPLTFQKPQASNPIFPKTITITNPSPKTTHPLTIRNFTLPETPRPIRPTDIAFLPSGHAFLCTLDGDIWKIWNLEKNESSWLRVATGIFEPMAISIDPNGRIFVLGRDQITELIDTNNDHHIDIFRCASDAFSQTLHTRDFSTSMEIEPDGSFLIAKGGIEKEGGITFVENSPHRGSILRISQDGSIGSLAYGLRMPFVGRRNDGAIFASDQQGNEIPSTPIHLISNNKPFLGFSPTNFFKNETITEPLLYYPYQTNRSAAAFATSSSKAFSDLPDSFLQISWNGRIFTILTPATGQAFSWMLPLQLDFPSLNASTHPITGQLYATGLGISGYKPTTPQTMGLASIEQSSTFPAPTFLKTRENQIEISLNRPLTQDESITPATLRLFNIKRAATYGSGHYLWDDKPGEHLLTPDSYTLSPDRKTLFIEFPLIRKSDVLDLQLNVTTRHAAFPIHLFSRPFHLPFATPKEIKSITSEESADTKPGNPEKGKIIFTQFGCGGCHSLNNEKLTGPPLNGIPSRANAATLRESIINPSAKITQGYPPSMPSFAGVIPPQDLEDLISYLQTLKN